MFDLDDRSRKAALGEYFEARFRSANFVAKKRIGDDPDHAVRAAEYARKNVTAIEGLRANVFSVGIDQSCDPGMLSVRRGSVRFGHIPAGELPDDIHDVIVNELSAREAA